MVTNLIVGILCLIALWVHAKFIISGEISRSFFSKRSIIFKMALSEGSKQRLSIVFETAKTVFHYAFIPTVLYLGMFKIET